MSFRIEDHVEELRDPSCFGGAGEVEQFSTQISLVCVVGERAYKFKKAVKLPFLDFSTAERREAACRQEVDLNRRLSPELYLGVEPLRRAPDGSLRVGVSDGELVDHCVVMRRLPQERMLDRLLAEDAVEAEQIRELARQVAEFHRTASRREEVCIAGAPAVLAANLRANFDQLRPYVGELLDAELFAEVERGCLARLPALIEALERRAAEGRVVEGHGDLHARNICLLDSPVIYDGIEFRLDFRAGDVADDVAFLAMDLRYRGHLDLAWVLVQTYRQASGDGDLMEVLSDLLRYRAMIRAKVDVLACLDESISAEHRTELRASARRRLRLCAWTLGEDAGPCLLVACGLPGSGKSTLFKRVAKETGWPLFATDPIRKELAGVSDGEQLTQWFYRAAFTDRVYSAMLRRAVSRPGTVLVDGNFRSERRRDQARGVAWCGRKQCTVVELQVDDALARDRLRRRRVEGRSVSDADEAVFDRLWAEFEAPTRALPVDGSAELDDQLDAMALQWLRQHG